MSLRETMVAFLATQLDFIFFFYGLAFILLGAICFAIKQIPGRTSAWMVLGLFGFVHGTGEWLDLIALVVADSPLFALTRTVLMAASFLLLMEFALQNAVRFGMRPLRLPIYAAAIALVAIGQAAGGPPMAGAFARYGIGFFAALAASWVFILHGRGFSGANRRRAFITASTFALYAIAAAIVPAAPFWPANAFDNVWFFQLTGIPIQLVRGLLACLLAFSICAIWGQLLVAQVSSERYTEHLRRQFIWTLAAMATILAFGWTMTQFFGGVYARNVEESSQGDVSLLAGRIGGEMAIVDGMVKTLAGSRSLPALLSGAGGEEDRRARSILDLDVETSDARFGAILDRSGTLVASSDTVDAHDTQQWRSAPWFQTSLAGLAGSHFAFDPANGRRYYYASYPVRRDDGSIAGVAVLQKSLERLDSDLGQFARSYFFIDPDGIVVLTNRPAAMLRTLWPLATEKKSILTRQFGMLNDQPMAERELEDATWVMLDGRENYVRRLAVPHSQWSVVLAMPKSRIYASRISGIVITLLVTMMALFYLFGREQGVRDRIQMDRQAELQELARTLRFRASTDPLTGLYNRAKFDETLASEIAQSQRYKSSLALIMFDVDHFKRVNDVHGHQVGDDVLVRLSKIVAARIRRTDLLARWGGEEFVILVPGMDGQTAYQAAEKLKEVIAESAFDAIGTMSCSFGVTQYRDGDSGESLVLRADNALYRAKTNGRNRVELASRPDAVASVA